MPRFITSLAKPSDKNSFRSLYPSQYEKNGQSRLLQISLKLIRLNPNQIFNPNKTRIDSD